MASLARIYLEMFWSQCPIGTELTWAHALRKLKEGWVVLSNTTTMISSIILDFDGLRVVSLESLIKSYHAAIGPLIPTTSIAKALFYATFPLGYWSLLMLLLLPTVAFALVLMVVIVLFFLVFLGAWAACVFSVFLIWLLVYRYPVYEILYPRLRRWILNHNSKLYSPLSPPTAIIRVVRLKKGRPNEVLECDLLSTPLVEAEFEALSYVWGTTLVPYKILVNNKPFYITHNLHSALQELRYANQDRMLWIDAICINQLDNVEKSVQVQMMQAIYAKATKVTVWLGKAEATTKDFLQSIQQYNDISREEKEAWCRAFIDSPDHQQTWAAFRSIAENEWWNRAWIIQEVVMGKHVIVQVGSHHIDWEVFVNFITSEIGMDSCPTTAPLFASSIKELRSDIHGLEAIPTTFMDLAYRFRTQSATFGSDKLYALLGLIRPTSPTDFRPDYSKSPTEVFLDFTVYCLENNRLSVIAIVQGTELEGISWCRDWRLNRDGPFSATCMSISQPGNEYQRGGFCASDNHNVEFKVDLPQRVLSLKGFHMDTIVRVGQVMMDWSRFRSCYWYSIVSGWEHVAGGPWSNDQSLQAAFSRTITAGSWANEPQNFVQDFQRRGKPASSGDVDEAYEACIKEMATYRRFFVTQEGRFGLGPWNIKQGDQLCILLGGKTPFVLRQCAPPRKGAVEASYHRLIGEAYVDGLMYYRGNIKDDIRDGRVTTRWYHLR
ncbi:Heterokaryon incompatibility protein [Paramyrothecium foliicola]|nr:Heterokaryon incompatibility protein [Paramyrothecium foliicola]